MLLREMQSKARRTKSQLVIHKLLSKLGVKKENEEKEEKLNQSTDHDR